MILKRDLIPMQDDTENGGGLTGELRPNARTYADRRDVESRSDQPVFGTGRHIAFGFTFHGINKDDALPALELASAAQEVRAADQDVRVRAAGQRFGQQGAYTVVTHQRVAESDDEQRLHGRPTRWTEQEMQGS